MKTYVICFVNGDKLKVDLDQKIKVDGRTKELVGKYGYKYRDIHINLENILYMLADDA